MKIPAVPPVRPAALVLPNDEIEIWLSADSGESPGLTPEQANSIDGMTLETSRRLTAAVTNLATFLSNDPEFAGIVNSQEAPQAAPQGAHILPVSAASNASTASTVSPLSAGNSTLDRLAPVQMATDGPINRIQTSLTLPPDQPASAAIATQAALPVNVAAASRPSDAVTSTLEPRGEPSASAPATVERLSRRAVPASVQGAAGNAPEPGVSEPPGPNQVLQGNAPHPRGTSTASDGTDTNGAGGPSDSPLVSDATRAARASGTSVATDDNDAASTLDATAATSKPDGVNAPDASDATDATGISLSRRRTGASAENGTTDTSDAPVESDATVPRRGPGASAENDATGASDSTVASDASGGSNPSRRTAAPGFSDTAVVLDDSDNPASGDGAHTTRTTKTSDATDAVDTAGSNRAAETSDASRVDGATRTFVAPDANGDDSAGVQTDTYVPSRNETREPDADPDVTAATDEPGRNLQDADRVDNPLYAARSSDRRVDEQQREGDSSGSGADSDNRQDSGGGWNDSEGAASPARQQGAFPLVPFNRRLETNGVDPTTLLAAEFSTQSHAYGGHDPVNWIVPMTIGAPRMSTDGGASPLPIVVTEEELQSDEDAQPALPVPPKLAAPLILIPPAPARRRPALRRRRVRIAGRYKRFPWIEARYRVSRRLPDSLLSDPRCISVVERAACWVVRGSNRRGKSHSIPA